MFLIRYTNISPNFILILPATQKITKSITSNLQECFHETLQILKFVDFAKTQLSKYLEN